MALRSSLASLCLLLVLSGCGSTTALAPVSHTGKQVKKPVASTSPATHVVRKGETLYSIAFEYGQDYRQLAAINGIKSPYTIYIGQKLSLKGRVRSVRAVKKASKPSNTPRTSPKPAQTSSESTKSQANKPKVPASAVVAADPANWLWPSKGKVIQTFHKDDPTRKGIEISGRLGQPVLATAGGKVVYSGSGLRGYGRLIIVKHNERFLSAYAHNRKLLVKEGTQVKQGERIAEMGSSGADVVKLHFEIRRDGKPVDPLRYLPGS